MTGNELKSARNALGLSAEGFARTFGVASGRTVRAWEAGERDGKPAPVPQPIELLVSLALEVETARAWLSERVSQAARRPQRDKTPLDA